jgi:branched-chain amino acid transport system substrate-binding protein
MGAIILMIAFVAACGAPSASAPTAGTTASQPTNAPQPTAAGQAAASSSEPILLGVSGPLTGDAAQYGAQWKKGFDLAIDEINGAGGINGRKLQYDFQDSQSDPKQSVVVAQKFIADPRIVAELGDFSSTASMAASPLYQRAGLTQFGFTNSHPKFTLGGDYMWSNSTTQKDDAPALADYAIKDLGLKKIAVLNLNTDWGKATYDLFAQRVKEDGAEVVANEAYLADEKDFRSALTNIKNVSPDGVVLISYYNDAALITQQLRAQGLTYPVVADAATYSPEFLKLGGSAVDGVYTSSEFFPSDPRPEVQAFVKAFKAKYNEDPDLFAAIAYDAIKIISAAIEKGGADRKGIHDALSQLKDVSTVIYGKVSFNADRRISNPTLTKIVIKGGQFVVWDGKPAK